VADLYVVNKRIILLPRYFVSSVILSGCINSRAVTLYRQSVSAHLVTLLLYSSFASAAEKEKLPSLTLCQQAALMTVELERNGIKNTQTTMVGRSHGQKNDFIAGRGRQGPII